jgi:hypothetical protein
LTLGTDFEPEVITDVPFVRAFVVRYPGSSQSIQDFYDKYANAKQYRDTFDFLRKQGDIQSISINCRASLSSFLSP